MSSFQKGEWFDDEPYTNLSNYNSNDNVMDLRDWQRRAKKFFYENDGKCIFEVSTGAGKTYCTIDIIQDLMEEKEDMRVLVIVPKNVILEKTWYKEMVDFGFPIQDIGVYYGSVKEYAQITLTNMQNIDRIPFEVFDMLVVDEVHHFATDKKMKHISKPFDYKIGLTATLKRRDNKHYRLMKVFDYNTFKYNPKQALQDGILNPFDFFNIGVELDSQNRKKYDELTEQLSMIFQKGGSYGKLMRTTSPLKFKMLGLMNERKTLVNNYHKKFDVVKKIINNNSDSKCIIFNQFNKQTSKVYWHLLEEDVDCRVVHSGISKKKREKALIDFKNDRFNVMVTTKVLDEGYNLPKLDLAIIMAGDSTDKQTVQRMGRVLRKKKNQNSKLYQIYCVDTIEEKNAKKRSKMFKDLSSDYKDVIYNGELNF